MAHPYKITLLYVLLILLVILNGFFIWQNYGFYEKFKTFKVGGIENTSQSLDFMPKIVRVGNENTVSMLVPAVDTNEKGILTMLSVTAKPGTGKVLVDIDGLLFWADTQQSIRVARKVAADISKVNISSVDLIYNIYANASVIGGHSAGAALTVATIGALIGKLPKVDVMLTGTINHDGTIGPVSAILEKAKAAKAGKASVFLVPLSQAKEIMYETREHCEKYGQTNVCSSESVTVVVNVGEKAGIEVKEVSTIYEAAAYFFDN